MIYMSNVKMEEKIIAFVRDNKFLYDKRNPLFKSKEKKEKKWEELGQMLNLSTHAVKNRWRTIKDRHYRQKKKVLPSGSGSGVMRTSKYKYAEQLSFLDDCGSVNDNNYAEPSKSKDYNEFEMDILYDGEGIASNFLEQSTNDFESSETQSSEVLQSRSAPPKRRRLSNEVLLGKTNEQLLKMIRKFNEQNSHATSKEWSFCESLAVQLEEAKLPHAVFLKFQIKVLDLLREEVSLCDI